MLLNKVGRPSYHLPLCMLVWGVISAATSACTSFANLLVCRFMLGFIEAAFVRDLDEAMEIYLIDL